jgi:peptidoglycan hydrolase CwlO-like protein
MILIQLLFSSSLDIFYNSKGEDLDPSITNPDDKIKYLESQKKALEMQLAYKAEMTSNAIAKAESTKAELDAANEKSEEEKQTTMDVTRTMTRQYKGMQEDLLNKINERERMIAALKDELEMQNVVHAEQIEEKNRVIEEKDAEAAKQNEQMENMFKHFANLLVDARLAVQRHTKGGSCI